MVPLFIDCSEFMHARLLEVLPDYQGRLDIHRGDPDPETLLRIGRGRRVLLNGHTDLTAEILAQLPGLERIVFLGAGPASYIDLAAAEALGIAVERITGYGDRAVAEHSFGLILAAARQIATMDRDLREGRWDTLEGVELGGKRLGILGFGGIGRALAQMAAGFGMEVVLWNRSPVADAPCPQLPLEEVLESADVLSLNLALTPQTRGFLNAGRIARIRHGAIIVNAARAGLTDEAALRDALDRGALRHVALDVFDPEPLPADSPWLGRRDVTVTSHAGFKTPEASQRLLRLGLSRAGIDL